MKEKYEKKRGRIAKYDRKIVIYNLTMFGSTYKLDFKNGFIFFIFKIKQQLKKLWTIYINNKNFTSTKP